MKLPLIILLAAGVAHAAPPFSMSNSIIDDAIVELPAHDLTVDEIALEIDGRRIAPWKVSPWTRSGAPVNVTILVQGTEIWMGNDQIVDRDDPSLRFGVLPDLARELEGLRLFELVSPASHTRVGTYDERLHWIGDTMIRLGHQRDYFGHDGTGLSVAVETAAREMFERAPGRRQIIIALGDGCDRADDGRELRSWLESYRVELHMVIYKVKESCDGTARLTRRTERATTAEGIASIVRSILVGLDDRMYAWFDREQLPSDGELHEYHVVAAGNRLGPIYRARPARQTSGGFAWWIAAGGGLAALCALLWVIRRWYRSTAAWLR